MLLTLLGTNRLTDVLYTKQVQQDSHVNKVGPDFRFCGNLLFQRENTMQ